MKDDKKVLVAMSVPNSSIILLVKFFCVIRCYLVLKHYIVNIFLYSFSLYLLLVIFSKAFRKTVIVYTQSLAKCNNPYVCGR